MSMAILDVGLALVAIWLAIPCVVMVLECLAASPRTRSAGAAAGSSAGSSDEASAPPRSRMAVLVPAHDEEAGITATVTALRAQLEVDDRLVVIADNCTDGTAALALEAGAEVFCRNESDRRGKGFALAFGMQCLAADPPDAVVVVDADCRVSQGRLKQVATETLRTHRPVQAEYIIELPGRPSPKAAISALALTVRNRVRPRGLRRLGLPCPLTGSGMAFAWPLLQAMPSLGDNLVEDMVLGLELALRGSPPTSLETVTITSQLPSGQKAQLTQRRRWECGHLDALWHYGPRLLWAALAQRRLDLMAMALDLLVPPLALLSMLLTGVGLAAVVHVLLGGSLVPLATLAASTGVLAIAIVTAWQRFARTVLPLRALAAVPFYVAWKIPLYFSHFVRRKPKTWQRTARDERLPS